MESGTAPFTCDRGEGGDDGSHRRVGGGFFRRPSEIADLAQLGTAVVVNVSCTLEVLKRRYIERHPHRHPGHRRPEALPDLHHRVSAGEFGVPDLGRPTLGVDTTDRMDPPEHEVLRWVRSKLNVGGEP